MIRRYMLAITGLLDIEIWGRGSLIFSHMENPYSFIELQNSYHCLWNNHERAVKCQGAIVNKIVRILQRPRFLGPSSWSIRFNAVPTWLLQRYTPAHSTVTRRRSLEVASIEPSGFNAVITVTLNQYPCKNLIPPADPNCIFLLPNSLLMIPIYIAGIASQSQVDLDPMMINYWLIFP